MDQEQGLDVKRIGIVGGGKVGQQLLLLFSNSQKTKVEYVVDINPSAPALEAARQAGIRAFTRLDEALSNPVDLILEVTGNAKVVETITRYISLSKTELITHDMAFILLSVVNENNQKAKDTVVREIDGVKNQIGMSLQGIAELTEDIKDITEQMNILAINARIEAARVGDQGKSFAVVAVEMGKSAELVKEITRQIEQVNTTIQGTAAEIDVSLDRLRGSG